MARRYRPSRLHKILVCLSFTLQLTPGSQVPPVTPVATPQNRSLPQFSIFNTPSQVPPVTPVATPHQPASSRLPRKKRTWVDLTGDKDVEEMDLVGPSDLREGEGEWASEDEMEDIQGVEVAVETVSKPITKSPSKSPKSSCIGVLLILEKNKFSEPEKLEVDK
jgi:hypothetical protein